MQSAVFPGFEFEQIPYKNTFIRQLKNYFDTKELLFFLRQLMIGREEKTFSSVGAATG